MPAALLLLAGLASTSCENPNDWCPDSDYDRLFRTAEISITAEATEAEAKWSSRPNTEYYIIELSKEELTDEIALGGTSTSIVYGEDKSITSSPFTLTDLDSDSYYYLRIKGMSSTNESNWTYYDDGNSFKTKAEQIFNDIENADRAETSVRLSWEPGLSVTTIEVREGTSEGTVIQTIPLDDAAKAAGEYTVTGLTPSTAYTFIIYNNDIKRGTVATTTPAEMPAGDYKVELPEGTTAITQEMFDEYVAAAKAAAGSDNASVTIGIPGGSNMALTGKADSSTGDETNFEIPDGISVTFFGLAGDKASLSLTKTLEVGGTHNYIRFENVDLVDNGSQYIINQSAACNITEITFKTVNITKLARSLVRLQGSNSQNIETINIDDCVISNQGSGGYAVIQYKDGTNLAVGTINVSNSTFSQLKNSFILCQPSTTGAINVSDCTFYGIIASGKYFIDAKDVKTNITLTNLLLAKTGGKGIRTKGTTAIENVYMTSDFALAGNKFTADITSPTATSEELFTDPTNGDFTVKLQNLAGLGDPRWKTAE